jgi:crotonobetainyl-CoA:carnitine CoA-transferase CaiB-like acyl-CoA transferase
MSLESKSAETFLDGIRVIEIADELGEYCGKVLAGIGAEVIKVEPPEGESTRAYGPFYRDKPDPEGSLYFWHYNFGKKSVQLDLESADGQETLRKLCTSADVLIDTRAPGYLGERGLGYEDLKSLNPGLVYARISPFGDSGPWGSFKSSDLVHLALGGVMMNCGYDPEPSGEYDTPPIAPQMWQAYHIAGEMASIAIIGALLHRQETGNGQYLSTAVHEAVSKQTETDMPNWIYARLPHVRATGRHSRPTPEPQTIAMTKDGQWLLPYRSYAGVAGKDFDNTVKLLDRYGMADDLHDERYQDKKIRLAPQSLNHLGAVVASFCFRFKAAREIWREAQAESLTWAPIRNPEENTHDEHWLSRQTFLQVEHPELGETFTEVGAKWMCNEVPWRTGPRAPLLGEHNDEVLAAASSARSRGTVAPVISTNGNRPISKLGKPFALTGVRFVDLTWLLASGGAGRFLGALGADVIKVEHESRPDSIRFGNGIVPPGGRAERDAATAPIPSPRQTDPNRGGFFMDINAGKRAISLNLKHPRGMKLLHQLLADADIVAEGFSPGTMDRLGLGYDRLKEINPRIIYVQQSGMGQLGTYGNMRSYGPVAAAFSGLTQMSGLPDPYPPTGIGYSYLDWFGAYNMALAIMAALYRQRQTGKGCWIDSSQVETGTYINGTAILDYSANGRAWKRYGNRSPYKPAAPHGAYRAKGNDRWIAISCFTDAEWDGLVSTLGTPAWSKDPRFATLESRIANQDALDSLVEQSTSASEPYELMTKLQEAGVAAGVCQTAEDRYEHDPQLDHLNWLVELPQTTIGTWPVKEFPVKFSDTPAYMGGVVGRSGPNYGEDNEFVYKEVLGLSAKEIEELAADGAI